MSNSVPKSRGWKGWIKPALFFCLYYSGLEWLLARLIRADAAAILMYHGVCDDAPMPRHINFHHQRASFERQMRVLKRRYRVVPLLEIVDALRAKRTLNHCVALTLDDGYRNNILSAAPILQRLSLPFTIFVATAYVDSGAWMPLNELYWRWFAGVLTAAEMERFREQLRGRPGSDSRPLVEELRSRPVAATAAAEESFAMLSWDEINALANSGVDFGSHTHTHCNMAVEDRTAQQAELEMSKSLLESRLERPTRTFAYPYGRAEHMSEGSRRAVIAAGFDCAISAEYGVVTSRSDPFRLPRLGSGAPIWMFSGELLYQFAREATRASVAKLRGEAHRQHA
ncbi:MAG TPA: polysaccharide deacetylase family protein [Bryobacteraceae bacterium]